MAKGFTPVFLACIPLAFVSVLGLGFEAMTHCVTGSDLKLSAVLPSQAPPTAEIAGVHPYTLPLLL